jgi:hypothetical protein
MGKKDFKEQEGEEMTLAEAKAYRASLHKPEARKLSEAEKKDQFRLFWAQSRKKYGKPRELEPILWIHLKATGNAEPEKFEEGIKHFGLKKVK